MLNTSTMARQCAKRIERSGRFICLPQDRSPITASEYASRRDLRRGALFFSLLSWMGAAAPAFTLEAPKVPKRKHPWQIDALGPLESKNTAPRKMLLAKHTAKRASCQRIRARASQARLRSVRNSFLRIQRCDLTHGGVAAIIDCTSLLRRANKP